MKLNLDPLPFAVFNDFEGFLFFIYLEALLCGMFFFLWYNLGFRLFMQKQAKFRLAPSPVLRDFTDIGGIAPIETG